MGWTISNLPAASGRLVGWKSDDGGKSSIFAAGMSSYLDDNYNTREIDCWDRWHKQRSQIESLRMNACNQHDANVFWLPTLKPTIKLTVHSERWVNERIHVFTGRAHSKTKTPVFGNATPVLGMKPTRGWYVFFLFEDRSGSLALSLKRSRRELPMDVPEHRSMMKNYQNTHYPRFG